MRFVPILLLVVSSAWGQADAVVAEANGKKVTADQLRKMVAAMPIAVQQSFRANPQGFMKEYAWYMHLLEVADKKGFDKQSPLKEFLEFQRMMTIVRAMHGEAQSETVVVREDEQAYYEANKEKFREVQTKLIYIPFSASSPSAAGAAKKGLSDAEAKAKAESIAKQARSGVDFVKLVKQHSEDPASAAQNGDFGIGIRATSAQVPEPMRKAVLALKPGEVSDAVGYNNGYYVFRAVSTDVLPYEKVREEIYSELKQQGFNRWVKQTQADSKIQIQNEELLRTLAQEVQPKQ